MIRQLVVSNFPEKYNGSSNPRENESSTSMFYSFVTKFSLRPHSTIYPNWISTLTIQILQITHPHWSQYPILIPTFLISLYQSYPPLNIVLQVPVFRQSSEILRVLINLVPSKNPLLLVLTLPQSIAIFVLPRFLQKRLASEVHQKNLMSGSDMDGRSVNGALIVPTKTWKIWQRRRWNLIILIKYFIQRRFSSPRIRRHYDGRVESIIKNRARITS